MNAAKSGIPWLVSVALVAPTSVAAEQASSSAQLAGPNARGTEVQWPPSLRDPTAPLIRSSAAREDASPFEPFEWRPRVHGFRHAAYERFCEAMASASELRSLGEAGQSLRRLRMDARRAPAGCGTRR